MNGVEKITERINLSAKEEAERVRAQASAEIAEADSRYAAQIKQIEDEAAQRIARETAEAQSRTLSAAESAKRSIALAAKSKAIDGVYKAVRNNLLSLSGDERGEFLRGVLHAAIEDCHKRESAAKTTFGEDIRPSEYVVCLNKSDLDGYGNMLCKAAKETGETVYLGEPADIDGGLLLKCGDTLINCSLEMIMKDAREKTEARTCEILFSKK